MKQCIYIYLSVTCSSVCAAPHNTEPIDITPDTRTAYRRQHVVAALSMKMIPYLVFKSSLSTSATFALSSFTADQFLISLV